MNIQIKKRGQLELSPTFEKEIISKFEGLEKLVSENAFLELEFIDEFGEQGGEDKRLELNLDVPGENPIHLEETTSDFLFSAEALADRLQQTLVKIKEKKQEHPKPLKEEIGLEEEL